MTTKTIRLLVGCLVASAALLPAQQFQRRASFVNNGDPARGKCTVEVRVDGAAEVAIQGDNATLRNLQGRPPEWRRFECNGPLPPNPVEFRFAGVDGRGRQTLIRDPRQGGVAVVRIEDPDNGMEGYTFDIFWSNGGAYPPPPPPVVQQGPYRGGDRDRDRDRDRRFGPDQAVDLCRESIRDQARDRFRNARVEFREIRMDDRPGRGDWVFGTIDVRRGYDRDRVDSFRFSCSVNFDTGRLRSARIEDR